MQTVKTREARPLDPNNPWLTDKNAPSRDKAETNENGKGGDK